MGEIESFDRYTVVSRIACGSYGCTYEVQSETGEHLALKWLRSDPADHARERFTNEVWALRQLTHPCIPHFVGQGCRDDRPFIVMSLARGETLRRIVERQSNEQGPMSQQRLLGIIEQVLSALEHMHSLGIFHRDVKDDNIIANPSESQVTLVDLGVCKGVGQPVDAATFWNAGASRYSPPSKLKNPTAAQASHDVFAVGVTAYLLLTNNYPWTVGLSEDRGHLEDLMRSTNPAPVSQRNPFVSREVSDFVMSLLATDDAQRPTATESLNKVREIRTRLSERVAPPAILAGKAIQFPRVIRDSLHGDILMTEFEWKLIDTPEFQRLRWVRQLGTSHLVYPGAEHTRFSHALGTLFVTEQILHKIEQRTGSLFEPEERLMARIYALLHDITHIAYGHTLEDELNLFHRHDRNDQRIQRLVLDDKSSLGDLLRSESYGQIVLAHFDSASTIGKQSWLQELVESPSGADVIDYIERDSLHCGLDHKVDSAIFRRFSIGGLAVRAGPESRHFRAQLYSRKGFRLDAEFALESILLERLGLFMKVYTHPVKTAAGCMIGKALFEARRDDKDVKLSERAIEQMGDLELLLQLRNSANSSAKHLC